MTGRQVACAAVALALLAGCSGGGTTSADPATTRSSPSSSAPVPARGTTADLPACPSLKPVRVHAEGLPALTLPCLGDGPDVRLSDLRGTPMVLTVWAAWCTNCDREMPLFSRLQEQAGPRVRMFGVHYKAARDFGLQSASDFGVTFPSVHDEDGDATAVALGAPGPPTTLFVTADGRVAGRKIGEIRSYDELTRLVRMHLGVSA